MDQALEILPADYWRWWLMANVPEGSDSNFTWESFQAAGEQGPRRRARQLRQPRHQVRRRPLRRHRSGDGAYGAAEAAVTAEIAGRLAAYEAAMEAIELRKAAQELRAIWVAGNEYLQAAAPWTAIRTDPDRAAADHPLRPEPDPPLRRAQPPVPARRRRRHAGRAAPRRRRLARPTSPPRSPRSPPATPSPCPSVLFAKLDDTRTAALAARFAGAA